MNPTSLLHHQSLLLPFTRVAPGQLAIKVSPGNNPPLHYLTAGLQAHWPLIASIRVYHRLPVTHVFGPEQVVSRYVCGDEAIIAVSKDLRLFAILGEIRLALRAESTAETLEKLPADHPSSVIRPIIRQAVRHITSQYNSEAFPLPSHVADLLQHNLQELFTPYCIEVLSAKITTIKPYHGEPTQPS